MGVPDFVVRLRKRVGHDLLWLPGTTAVVVRDDDVLLVRRSDNGEWTPVTGIVDPGELPSDCAIREIWEETAVTAEIVGPVHVSVTPVITHVNGDIAQYLDHTYLCRWVSGDARVNDDESVDVAWFPIDALPPMRPVVIERMNAVLGRRIQPAASDS